MFDEPVTIGRVAAHMGSLFTINKKKEIHETRIIETVPCVITRPHVHTSVGSTDLYRQGYSNINWN